MRRARVGMLALLALLALPACAHAGGSGIALSSNVTKADTVGVKISLGGFPHERCEATVRKGNRTASGGAVHTSRNGGAEWSWLIPGNVPAGVWKFSVLCTGGRHRHRASTTFHADGGIGRRSRGLWIPGTLEAQSVVQPRGKVGNGSGGGAQYPVGQCTWWVAIHRPDLPFFPGASGDALNWARSAKARGFPVGSLPTVGSVAVFQPGQYGAGPYGHVALVVGVTRTTIRISEANFRGESTHDERTIGFEGLRFIYRKGNPAPGLSAILTSPIENQLVQGAVTVTAQSNAPAIRFAIYSYSNPAVRASGNWEILGEDRTPADGFTATWDTTATPNQGGLGGSSVLVRAIVLRANGSPTGAYTDARVDVANSRTSGGQTYFPYYVVGTCEEGECGLHVRSGPGFSTFPVIEERHDGEEVDISCQAHGETFVSAFGGKSDIWDRLTNGGWVTDFFVDTPERGVPSPPIPSCS